MTENAKAPSVTEIAIKELKSSIIAYNKSFVAGIHIRAGHIYIKKYKN